MSSKTVRLNPEQKKAVDTIQGPLLIIAGAGSGKTGVITSRIANMLNHGIPQRSILALTFTNKAAKEMSERVKTITGKKLTNLTTSTFHAFGVKVLRTHIQHLGYKNNFTIYDSNDKISCLKESARELKLRYEFAELQELGNLFSQIKTRQIPWDATNDQHKPLYNEYLDHLKLFNAVDFDDLIVLPIQLFEEHPEVLEEYRNRYKYIMVDEFQDTSLIQYEIIRLLGITNRNVCCVGDDDQSIYSWRGANYKNIEFFERDFSELVEIKLERNYRSTGIILDAANAVIANNTNRKEKALWTENGIAHNIKLFHPDNETHEAQFIASTINRLKLEHKLSYDNFGILVRTNSLCKNIEEALLEINIPYSVTGGQSFFQRKEVKDIIAYLRVIINPDDDVNLLRILNTPRRGLGKKALELLNEDAAANRTSLYTAITNLAYDSSTPKRIAEGLSDFMVLIEEFGQEFENAEGKSAPILKDLIESLDYWGYLVQEFAGNDKAAKWRYDNLILFTSFLERWENNSDNLEPTLLKWLNRISLITKDELDEDGGGKVNLMTIHASKGLEFNQVFLAGVEEELIPHARSVAEDPANLEEERRLFYVAITRARDDLYMTCCKERRNMTATVTPNPSPFLEEIPKDCIEVMEEETTASLEETAEVCFSNLPWKK